MTSAYEPLPAAHPLHGPWPLPHDDEHRFVYVNPHIVVLPFSEIVHSRSGSIAVVDAPHAYQDCAWSSNRSP